MKIIAIIVGTAALAAGPVLAQESAITPAPERDAAGIYQVFRTTDSQLSCAQLSSELNLLNAQVKKQAEAGAKKGSATGRVAGGAAVGALAGAARFGIGRNIPRLGYAGAQVAASATDAAAQAALAKEGRQAAAPATVSDEQQRMSRVTQLFDAKSC